MNRQKKKVLLVEDFSAPYRDDTFAEMVKRGCQIRILTQRRAYEHEHNEWEYISPLEAYRSYADQSIPTKIGAYRCGLLKKVKTFRPDAVCTGSMLEGLAVKLFSGYRVRVVLCSDTMQKGRHGDSVVNRILLTVLYRTGDALWVAGRAAKKYYNGYLKGARPIYQGWYTYDAKRLAAEEEQYQPSRCIEREKLGLAEKDFVFLFIGKLIPSRRVDLLLEAAAQLEQECPEVKILAIGDGEMEGRVADYQAGHSNVIHIPRAPRRGLEKYYAAADAYVHPGAEPYSLALYEAAVLGMPMVASVRAGATADCLRDGRNGFYFSYGDPQDLFQKMKQAAAHKKELEQGAGKVKAFILAHRGNAWSAGQLMQACGFTVQQ